MDNCERCDGDGWLLKGTRTIEACTTCRRFDSDDEAAQHMLIRYNDMFAACISAKRCLDELCGHEAFSDDAPEFNSGGVGHETNKLLRAAIAKAKP